MRDVREGPVATEVSHVATYRGDLNTGLAVDIFDYNIMIADFGQTDCGSPADADKDCSETVGIFDYNLLVRISANTPRSFQVNTLSNHKNKDYEKNFPIPDKKSKVRSHPSVHCQSFNYTRPLF